MSDVSSEAAAMPAVRELPLEFRATGGEYFRIWIVNLLLTIITLGIYSAWAKVRRLRYFYGSTSLDGSSFEYHGQPIAILKGRLIVFGFYVLFVLITAAFPLAQLIVLPIAVFGVPWIIVRARLFQMRMTAWRGLRFNFHGRYGGAMAAYIGWMLLAILTLGVLWPMALWKQVRYLATHTAYGSQRFDFATRVGTFYKFCVLTLLLMVGIGIVCGILVAVAMLAGGMNAGAERVELQGASAASVLLTVPLTLLMLLVAGAYFRANFLNASIGGIEVGPHRLNSRLKTLPLMGILFTNLLGMVVTLGLFYPWAKVRLLRYQLTNTSVQVSGDLGQFVADAEAGPSALGEEAGDFFDVDFGI